MKALRQRHNLYGYNHLRCRCAICRAAKSASRSKPLRSGLSNGNRALPARQARLLALDLVPPGLLAHCQAMLDRRISGRPST